MNRQNSNCK